MRKSFYIFMAIYLIGLIVVLVTGQGALEYPLNLLRDNGYKIIADIILYGVYVVSGLFVLGGLYIIFHTWIREIKKLFN